MGFKIVPLDSGSLKPFSFKDFEAQERERLRSQYEFPPEPTGIAGLYKKIPTNMRLLIENIFGRDTTITEKDFTTNELLQMAADIENQQKLTSPVDIKKGGVGINPYDSVPGRNRAGVDASFSDSLSKSFKDPKYTVATSLGRYDAEDTGQNLRVRDTYNFNKNQRNLPTDLRSMLRNVLYSPELAGEYLANFVNTPSRTVDINLKKVLNKK